MRNIQINLRCLERTKKTSYKKALENKWKELDTCLNSSKNLVDMLKILETIDSVSNWQIYSDELEEDNIYALRLNEKLTEDSRRFEQFRKTIFEIGLPIASWYHNQIPPKYIDFEDNFQSLFTKDKLTEKGKKLLEEVWKLRRTLLWRKDQ